MILDLERELRTRADEVRDLLGQNKLSRAAERLLDFVATFSTSSQLSREAILHKSNVSRWLEEERQIGPSQELDSQRKRLVLDMTRYLDAVCDRFHANDPDESLKTLDRPDWKSLSFEESRKRFLALRTTSAPPESDVIFRCQDVEKSYRKRPNRFLLSRISLSLKLGTITGLVGGNGAGKSTFLRLVAGELARDGGEIAFPLLDQKPEPDWRKIRPHVAFVPQRPDPWHGRLAQNLHKQAALHRLRGKSNHDEVDFIIHRLGLSHYRDFQWEELSGGFRTRAELARALVTNPRLLILDEPLAHLDVVTQQLFLRDLRDISRQPRQPLPILLSSQHLHEIEAIADQILFLRKGQLAFNGPPSDLDRDRKTKVYDITVDASGTGLEAALKGFEVEKIEDAGTSYIVSTPLTIDGFTLMRHLISAGARILYFRDITRSTRTLFENEREEVA